MMSSITNVGEFLNYFLTKGYPRVQTIIKIKSFDYLLMYRLTKHDIWVKFSEIWVNLVKFSRLGCIQPLSLKICNKV